MDELLVLLGFSQIGEVVDQHMSYRTEAREVAGLHGAVYVFVNPDPRRGAERGANGGEHRRTPTDPKTL